MRALQRDNKLLGNNQLTTCTMEMTDEKNLNIGDDCN